MTEKELRDKVAGLAEEWCRKGVWEWNSNLDYLIKVYNEHRPLTRNIEYSKDMKPNGWCALGVSDMFILADLADLITTEIGAYEFMVNAKKAGQWKPRGTYVPKRGDIVCYAFQATSESGKEYTQYHVALCTNASSEIIYTTEFNVQHRCLMLAHKPDDKTISGFWAVDYASAVTVEENSVVLPVPPKANGTYTLKAVVSNNGVSYKWV